MPDAITEILDQMQARADAATPGPWVQYAYPGESTTQYISRATGDEAGICQMDGRLETRSADGRFIASSRTDLPRALAALRVALPKLDAATLTKVEAALKGESQ